MDSWLTAAVDAVATTADVPRASLNLTDEEVEKVLELARIAARDSSQRTNAPLICYLVGLAVKASGKSLEDIAAAVPSNS
jgi:hypothetical protein